MGYPEHNLTHEDQSRGGVISSAHRVRAAGARRAGVLNAFSQGATIEEACEEVGVSVRTYRNWRSQFKDWAGQVDAVRGGKRLKKSGEILSYKDDFLAFRKKYLNTDTTWFQAQMAEALMDEAVGGGHITLVLFPPEHGKTTVVEDFCTWKLATDHDYRITYGSESQSHSRKALRRVRNRLEIDGPFPALVSHWGPFAPQGLTANHRGHQPWGADFFDIADRQSGDERDYSMVALGFGSQIAGSRADLLVGDDLMSMRNINQAEKLFETFRQDWLSRPGTKGRTVVVGTRVKEGDIYDLMEDDDLPDEIIRFKAHDPMRIRSHGGPWLWPERYSEEEYAKMRKNVGESAWARNYQQAPRQAGDSTFTDKMLEDCDMPLRSVLHEPPVDVKGIVISLDPGFGHNATLALGVAQDHLHLLSGRDDQGLTNNQQIFAIAEQLYLETKGHTALPWLHFVIEDKAFQKGLIDDAALKELQRRYGFTVHGHQTGTNKYDQNIGVPAMARDFLREQITLPGAEDEPTEAFRAMLDDQLLRWRPNKKGTELKQDLVMALWFGWIWWTQFRTGLDSRTNNGGMQHRGTVASNRVARKGLGDAVVKEFSEIITIVEDRRLRDSPMIKEMLEVRKRYHADYVIPIPEMDDQPELPPLTPALVANAIDQPALAAAQVQPDVSCPPLDFSKRTGIRSREYARKREHAIKHSYRTSKMQLQLYRMFRHMSGYATSTVVTRPHFVKREPIIEVRDPLTAYPEPKAAEDLTRVADCAFVHARSAEWLRARFPQTRQENGGPVGMPGRNEGDLWDVLEWWDADQVTWGLLGPQYDYQSSATNGYLTSGGRVGPSFWLNTFENKVGHCPVASMPRITLDKIATQVAHNTGIIDFMGRLLMLDMIAAERNVFPDRYIVGERGQMPRITTNGGNWADGREGQTNILEGVAQIGELRSQPDPMTRMAYDTLERNYKVSTGQTGIQSGENNSNLRTGRAISEIYGVSVDPRVMELQRIAEHGLAEINEDILATWESEWPEDKVRLFSGFGGNSAVDEMVPATHIEKQRLNAVSYSIPGADVQQTTIALGQLLGTEAISTRTFRLRHPWVDDAEAEERQVEVERIQRAMFDSVLMRAQNGELPLTYLAQIGEYISDGESIADAIRKADEKLREEQATPPEQPEQGVAPEAMPGLEAAGPGADQLAALGAGPGPTGAPIGPTEGQVGLDQLMSAMRGGSSV